MLERNADLRARLISALCCYESNTALGSSALERVVEMIPDQCADKGLWECVRSCLTGGDSVLANIALSAVERFGPLAEHVIQELLSLAQREEKSEERFATVALGMVPSSRAIKAIVEIIESWSDSEAIMHAALPAFFNHGLETEPYLDRVQSYLDRVCPAEREIYCAVLNSLRDQIRMSKTEEIQALALPVVVDLDEIKIAREAASRWNPMEADIDKPDLSVCEQSFRFRLKETVSEVRVSCQSYDDEPWSSVVVIWVDEDWYGIHPRTVPELLATAIKGLYDLDPEDTRWVVRELPSSGHAETGVEEFWRIHFDYDHHTEHYTSATCRRYQSMTDALKQ